VTLKDRLVALMALEPGLTDRELADRLLGRAAPQQSVNQAARQLAAVQRLTRRRRPDGRIGNYPVAHVPDPAPVAPQPPQPAEFVAEDDVKRHVQHWLESEGWVVTVVWGKGLGIDMDARREGLRWIIEAKGQGSRPQMRVNFFLGALGELLQRMTDPEARYSMAMPDLQQYRRLWQRLPRLAKERTRVSAIFVTGSGEIEEVP
jgi:hypothetical protein